MSDRSTGKLDPGIVAVPRIPPPPPNKRQRGSDGRWSIWTVMFILGAIVGTAFYQWVPAVTFYFDYWIALATR